MESGCAGARRWHLPPSSCSRHSAMGLPLPSKGQGHATPSRTRAPRRAWEDEGGRALAGGCPHGPGRGWQDMAKVVRRAAPLLLSQPGPLACILLPWCPALPGQKRIWDGLFCCLNYVFILVLGCIARSCDTFMCVLLRCWRRCPPAAARRGVATATQMQPGDGGMATGAGPRMCGQPGAIARCLQAQSGRRGRGWQPGAPGQRHVPFFVSARSRACWPGGPAFVLYKLIGSVHMNVSYGSQSQAGSDMATPPVTTGLHASLGLLLVSFTESFRLPVRPSARPPTACDWPPAAPGAWTQAQPRRARGARALLPEPVSSAACLGRSANALTLERPTDECFSTSNLKHCWGEGGGHRQPPGRALVRRVPGPAPAPRPRPTFVVL